ncbi:MAG: type II CAAX endopeptidase family protein [bacterium]
MLVLYVLNLYQSDYQYESFELQEILYNPKLLVDYYQSIKFDNSNDKRLFFLFIITLGCIFVFLTYSGKYIFRPKLSNSSNLNYRSDNFYAIFFIYYFLQVCFQFIGLKIYLTFIEQEMIGFNVSVGKSIIFGTALILAPMTVFFLLHATKKFDFYMFFVSFLRFLNSNTKTILGLILSCAFIFVLSLAVSMGISKNYDNSFIVVYVRYSTFYEMVLYLVTLVIVVPLIEEIIFRKHLIDMLSNFMSKVFSILISSFIFSIVHFQDIYVSLLIGAIGVFLGIVYIRYASIVPTVFCHSLLNFLSLLYWIYT